MWQAFTIIFGVAIDYFLVNFWSEYPSKLIELPFTTQECSSKKNLQSMPPAQNKVQTIVRELK